MSPCPLSTNIAAVSFISRRLNRPGTVALSGICYAAGRGIAYAAIAFVVVEVAISVPQVSNLLQEQMNKILGILLLVVGAFLLGLLPIRLPSLSIDDGLTRRLDGLGLVGSLLLGIIFALAFCPVSAALYFGSVIPLAISAESSVLLPVAYSLGTALPVLVFGGVLAAGGSALSRAYNQTTRVEAIMKRLTGLVFTFVGIYTILKYLFGIL
jgi:cytochrome c biogenesis protein CcdA